MIARQLARVPRKNLLAPARASFGCCRHSAQGENKEETYTERQARSGKPLSPHVQIYKFPLAATSSIVNRVTGVGMTAG